MYLLDTTHCIKSMIGDYEIDHKLSNMPNVQIATCLIVRGELMFGAYKSDQFSENLHRLESFFAEIPIYGMNIEKKLFLFSLPLLAFQKITRPI